MTCIVGLVSDGKIYMGGDSAGVSGWDLILRADGKVFKNGEFIMGFTTSFRMGQLLQYGFAPPARIEGVEIHRFMVTTFVDSIRTCLKAGGFAKKENEIESGGQFLVGYQGHLFEIDQDYQVGESADGFAAVGCGSGYALGSLFSTKGKTAPIRLRMALEAAEHMSAGVRGPFTILNA
jgi:ATP-dependent protease HslVU (ClpYQ) peptidase subunit